MCSEKVNSIASGGCLLLPICFSWQNPEWQSSDSALLMLVWKRVQLEMKAALQSGWLLGGSHFRAWEWLLTRNDFSLGYALGKKWGCPLRYSAGVCRAGEVSMVQGDGRNWRTQLKVRAQNLRSWREGRNWKQASAILSTQLNLGPTFTPLFYFK